MVPLKKERTAKSAPGFILADVLAAMVIAGIALSTILIGVAQAARIVSAQGARVEKVIEMENENETKTPQVRTAGP